MAASIVHLRSSGVFEEFFSQFRKSSVNQSTGESSILAIKNDIIFVWNNSRSVLNVLNVSSPSSKRIPQTLVCSQPPFFEVNSILLNDSDSHVALVGSKGVAILELPSMYGSKSQFQGGKERILCKCVLIDERYFSSHKVETAVKVLWHPGSPNSSHICVLTSTNTVRIYNISSVECPQQTIQLCPQATSRFSSALGESFVSMTFGQAITTSIEHHVIWPLYLLNEMGCVYLIHSKLWSKNRVDVEGPLRMVPPAEDNYGSDSCDILHLKGSPEALVISTSSGSLMHCLLLPAEHSEEDDMNIVDSLPVMHVYDIAKLELRLTVHSTANLLKSSGGEEPNTPVRLLKDPVWSDCYYCMHSAGIHHVKLPWLRNFEHFSVEDELSDEDSLCMIDEESATLCQQLVCTQPLAETKPCPIRGLAVVSNDLHSTSLYCLLSNFTCLKIPVRNGPACKQMTLFSEVSPSLDSSKLTRLSFNEHIAELLKRESTNPLIKTSSEQSLTPEQCYQLLSRNTQVFREQYVNKLKAARIELDRRVRSLDMLREQQSADLQALREQKTLLTDTAGELAERYEDVRDQDERLTARMDAVIFKIQQSMSDLSDGERSLSSHLMNRKEEINDLQCRLDQIKEKYKYQKEGLNKTSSTLPCLNETQLKSVNSILSDESQQIEGLVTRLRNMMAVTQ